MQTKGIFDLKAVQQNAREVVVFKNHLRQYIKIRPKNVRDNWTHGNTIEIPLVGQGLDYINFEGSMLVFTMSTAQGAGVPTYKLAFGAAGLIQRYQLRAGTTDVEDIDNYGRYVWLNVMGHGHHDLNMSDAYMSKAMDQTFDNTKGVEERTMRIPLITIFQNAGYVPIYNIAEELVLRLELVNPLDWIFAANNAALVSYQVTDIYFLADGLTATSGGNLSDQAFRFHAHTAFSRVEELTPLTPVRTDRFVYDLKKTSMKKFLAMFSAGRPANNTGAKRVMLSSEVDHPYTNYGFSLGGQPFPFKETLKTPIEMYFQYQKYFHRQDAIGNATEGVADYDADIIQLAGTFIAAPNDIKRIYPAAVFDKLDQIGTIVSGIDTERYDIVFELTYKTSQRPDPPAQATNEFNATRLFVFFVWDVIVTIIGGEIKIED